MPSDRGIFCQQSKVPAFSVGNDEAVKQIPCPAQANCSLDNFIEGKVADCQSDFCSKFTENRIRSTGRALNFVEVLQFQSHNGTNQEVVFVNCLSCSLGKLSREPFR